MIHTEDPSSATPEMESNNAGIISFFAGSGFLDLGFEMTSGFHVAFANEYIKSFAAAYEYSRKKMGIQIPEAGISTDDINSFKHENEKKLDSVVKTAKNSYDIIGFIGGPPCPDFSVGGKNRGKDGENGKLSGLYVDLIIRHKPDFFLFENVKGLYRTKKHRDFFDELKRRLEHAGYTLHEKLVNSLTYGAAQDRERILLVGFYNKSKGFQTKPAKIKDQFSWSDSNIDVKQIKNLDWATTTPFKENSKSSKPNNIPIELTVQYWFKKNNVDHHPNQKHCFVPRAGIAKFLTIDEGDDSRKSSKRLHRWRYSPTACYGNNEVHIHPYKARRITVAEALAIQSLPKEFCLPDYMSLTDMFKTVGNGVPFVLSKTIAESIGKHLCRLRED